MENRPLVSVIIPCYNKERYVERTLASLCAQTYADFEVKIVDDCSTDRTWEIVQGFVAKDSRFAAERNEVNKGGDYCRNRGAALSKGEYLIFLDADDWLAVVVPRRVGFALALPLAVSEVEVVEDEARGRVFERIERLRDELEEPLVGAAPSLARACVVKSSAIIRYKTLN